MNSQSDCALYGKRLSSGVANLPMTQSAESMIADLVRETETVVRCMREVVAAPEGADDVVTADLLTGPA
jgi:DNA-binding ferritin-like protein